jgi:dTDP-4-dehydrorhamnose 3,5-epimerase
VARGEESSCVVPMEPYTPLRPAGAAADGFQVPTKNAEVCYWIDRPHPNGDQAVHYDDPDLGITWPLQLTDTGPRDAAAGLWAELVKGLPR